MRFFGKWRAWKDLRLGQMIFYRNSLYFGYLQDYFIKRCDATDHIDPFYHGLNVFAAGYCSVRQDKGKCSRSFGSDGKSETFPETDFLDALEWMRRGIQEMSSGDKKMQPKEAAFYCSALDELSVYLDQAGECEMALQCIEYRISFGKKHAAQITCGETLERLNFVHALYLVHMGKYDEAIQQYPSKDILHAILEAYYMAHQKTLVAEMLPYVQAVVDSCHDPNGRCGEDDLEYAHRWLADFYLYTGSYADVIAIGLKDIMGNKIGLKRNRNAVNAYRTFAVSANKMSLLEFAHNAISTAYELAELVLDRHNDSDVALLYQLYIDCFEIYLSQSNLEKAEFFLSRAQKLLDERMKCQKQQNGKNEAIAAMESEFGEHIMLCKAGLFCSQGRLSEALEMSEQAVCIHNTRRQENPDRYVDIIDKFYIEALSVNIICMLCIAHGRSPLSDGKIRELFQELLYMAEELKLLTLDNVREDFIRDLQNWSNIIFSYWAEFQDLAISDEILYKLELNTKNIDLEIRYMQNQILEGDDSPIKNGAIRFERRELWENYQKEMFEGNPVKANQDFNEKQMSFDVKRFQFLKDCGFEFPYYEPTSLQERLGKHHALLEFRKFQRRAFIPESITLIDGEYWYGAFLITRDNIIFKSLGNAQEIEEVVSEILADIQDAGMIDHETVSGKILSHAEEVLLSPFLGYLDGIEILYIVPDDELYKVPFELMQVFGCKPATEKSSGIKICYLTSARSLLRDHEERGNYRSIRILADPEFKIENEPDIESAACQDGVTTDTLEVIRDMLLRSGPSALKYARFEAEAIKNIFSEEHKDVELLLGKDVRKSNVFTTQTDILHFATHGFAILEQWDEEENEQSQSGDNIDLDRMRRIAASHNALLRCGLFLSGADNWIHGTEVDGFGNGILTGMDILSQNLEGYKLVVLSACCTGQGSVACSGEGIESLRSAFELAGIPTLLCTLWEVDDFATALFMTEFYRELQESGTPLSALYSAKRTLRNMTYMDLDRGGFQEQADNLLKERMALSKEEKPFIHPRYWAGFILHGVSPE